MVLSATSARPRAKPELFVFEDLDVCLWDAGVAFTGYELFKHRKTTLVVGLQAIPLPTRESLQCRNLIGTELPGANLVGATLSGLFLKEDFTGADLKGADLSGAWFLKTNLEGANLEGAHLLGTKLTGVNLKGASLVGANLEGAKADEETIWPEGFDPEAAGVILED